jgi:hypothetical protein
MTAIYNHYIVALLLNTEGLKKRTSHKFFPELLAIK